MRRITISLLSAAAVTSAVLASTPAWSATAHPAPSAHVARQAARSGGTRVIANGPAARVECTRHIDLKLVSTYDDEGNLDTVNGSYSGDIACTRNMALLRTRVELYWDGIQIGTVRAQCKAGRKRCSFVNAHGPYNCDGIDCAGTYQEKADEYLILRRGSWNYYPNCVRHGKELICHQSTKVLTVSPED